MNHSFNVDFATKYGMAEAVIFENLVFWCKKNKANGANIKNGLAWTYNSVKAYEELFPYLKKKKIISALHNLEEKGLITTGSYNNNPYDRTKWYAVTDVGYSIFLNGEIDLPKKENGIAKTGKWDCQNGQMNITDINTDIKPDINTDIDNTPPPTVDAKTNYLRKIYNRWSSHYLPLSKASRGNFLMFETIELKPVLSQVLAMASQVDEVLQAIDNCAAVRDLIDAGGSWYSSPDNFRQFINKIDKYMAGAFDIAHFTKKQAAGAQYVDDDKIEF